MHATEVSRPPLVILTEVQVMGHAKTKGSLTFKGNGHVEEKPGSDRWRKLVAASVGRDFDARSQARGLYGPVGGRVGVRITTWLQAPAGKWHERWMDWLLSQFSGDGDKLARNVLDALTDSGVIADDGQVVDLFHHKRIAREGMMPGQAIQVWEVPEWSPW